jgi:hypothetical protein
VCGTPSHHPPPDGTDRPSENPAVESADVESAVTSAVAQVRAEMEAQLEVRALPGAHANACVCGVLWVVWRVGGVRSEQPGYHAEICACCVLPRADVQVAKVAHLKDRSCGLAAGPACATRGSPGRGNSLSGCCRAEERQVCNVSVEQGAARERCG